MNNHQRHRVARRKVTESSSREVLQTGTLDTRREKVKSWLTTVEDTGIKGGARVEVAGDGGRAGKGRKDLCGVHLTRKPQVFCNQRTVTKWERPSVSGSNSVVECQLPKLDVVGSSPISRSILSITYIASRIVCSVCAPLRFGLSPSYLESIAYQCAVCYVNSMPRSVGFGR